jgi:1,2-diacylglycerol 3-alpha-glucosyltransferase
MKILVLNPILFTSTDGSLPKVETIKDTMMYGMCLGLKSLGHEVTLISYDEYRPTRKEMYDFEVLFLKSNGGKFLPNALPLSLELKKYLKTHHQDYDMVLSSEVFAFHSLFAARICPEKTVIWQELTEHQDKFHQLPSKFWHHVVAKFFMQKVKAVVPRSTKAYDFIHQFMPMTTKKVVDHGINVDKFQYSTVKKRQIISSSQLIHRKNVDGIIHIFADFHQQKGYEDIKLLIAGRGEEEIRLKELVSMLGLNDSVEYWNLSTLIP